MKKRVEKRMVVDYLSLFVSFSVEGVPRGKMSCCLFLFPCYLRFEFELLLLSDIIITNICLSILWGESDFCWNLMSNQQQQRQLFMPPTPPTPPAGTSPSHVSMVLTGTAPRHAFFLFSFWEFKHIRSSVAISRWVPLITTCKLPPLKFLL